MNEEGELELKDKKEVSPDSMQNPHDQDASFRSKAGEGNVGSVANVVESTSDGVSIIEQVTVEKNTHSDMAFCKEVIEELGNQEQEVTLVADGAYISTETVALAAENNIRLVGTALLGKKTDTIFARFTITGEENVIVTCPMGNESVKVSYYAKTEQYRAVFEKSKCHNCPHRSRCNPSFMKGDTASLLISKKKIERAKYSEQMSGEEYEELSRYRNGVEGIPSVLRRKYGVDSIRSYNLQSTRTAIYAKVGAMNFTNFVKGYRKLARSI